MSLLPLFLRSVVRLMYCFVNRPVASVTTILFYSDLLPRNANLERMVRSDLLRRDNHLFVFLISVLRCFW